jgi:hypothetical protein
MGEGARLNAGAVDEGVEVAGTDADDASEPVGAQLVGVDELVDGAGCDAEVGGRVTGWTASAAPRRARRSLRRWAGCQAWSSCHGRGVDGRQGGRWLAGEVGLGDGQGLTLTWMWS